MLSAGTVSDYERTRDGLASEVRGARAQGLHVGLKKSTSNLFRRRTEVGKKRIDVSGLRHVLRIDRDNMLADVEGMTTYDALVSGTLRHGLLPAVTPELKTITAGGAVSGLGIESSSFRFGLVHETAVEMEILLGTGDVVRCSRDENRDLFDCIPNSYGTLGYILRLGVRLIPAQPYVRLTHIPCLNADEYFRLIETTIEDPAIDFVDGTVFSESEMYVTAGRMHEHDGRTSDYTWTDVYYRSIRDKEADNLTVEDYVWRWDTDWFWCSKQFHVQNPVVRLVATPLLLNSAFYQRVMRLSHVLSRGGSDTESVIQDVAIPVANAAGFLGFLLEHVPIMPIWICPFIVTRDLPLYRAEPGLYINFGFWGMLPARLESHYWNLLVEDAVREFGGRKALYSTSYYSRNEFRALFDARRYDEMKRRCDPDGVFGDLYEKCVLAK